MCGIVGIFDPQLSSEKQEKKIKHCLKISDHRGPDENDVFVDQKNKITLGMNRLSILDIENGHQPFFSHDKRYCLIFNGEIINSEVLKIKLKKKRY